MRIRPMWGIDYFTLLPLVNNDNDDQGFRLRPEAGRVALSFLIPSPVLHRL